MTRQMNKTIRDAYNRCKPEEWLEYGDKRYVPLTEKGLRGTDTDAVKTIFDSILLADKPACHLMSGFRGSGKTTELKRLAHDLREAGYWVVYVDTEEYLNLRVPATLSDIWITVAAGFDRFLSENVPETATSTSTRRKTFADRLNSMLERIKKPDVTVDLGLVQFNVSPLEDTGFREKLNKALKEMQSPLVKECRDFLDEATAILKTKDPGKSGVVLVLDSLEKLEGDARNADDVRTSVETLFNIEWRQLVMPCHSIFTVPPWITFTDTGADCDLGRTHLLPMCKTAEPDGPPYEKGIEAMLELLGKRIDLDAIFGDKKKDLLTPLISKSGGYPRDLLRMIRDLLHRNAYADRFPLDPEAVRLQIERVIETFREDYEQSLDGNDLTLLVKIAKNHSVVGWSRKDKFRLAQLFNSHFVMSYQNGQRWLDLHPLLRDTHSVQQAIENSERKEPPKSEES